MSDVTIRRARPSDDRTLRTLAERLASFPLPKWRTADEIASADARAMLKAVAGSERDDEVLVAERDGAVVGCLHMLTTVDFFGRRHAHVSVLATSAAAEGTGVGRRLMAHAEHWTRERGLTLLTLNVFAANSRARQLYERSGFEAEAIKYAKRV